MSMCRRARVLGVLSLCFAAPAAVAGQTKDPATEPELAGIRTLKCTFPVRVATAWAEGGEPQPQVKTTGVLSFQIDSIDTQDGSARFIGLSAPAAAVVTQLSGWSLHFLETASTGGLYVTTVFGQESRERKLKAVHTRTEFFPASIPGFTSAPQVVQYYGECESTPGP